MPLLLILRDFLKDLWPARCAALDDDPARQHRNF